MWEQYRKTFIPIQALILTVCAALYWLLKVDPRSVATVFVVMEIGSVYGASMGARWKRRIQTASETLPLSRRR